MYTFNDADKAGGGTPEMEAAGLQPAAGNRKNRNRDARIFYRALRNGKPDILRQRVARDEPAALGALYVQAVGAAPCVVCDRPGPLHHGGAAIERSGEGYGLAAYVVCRGCAAHVQRHPVALRELLRLRLPSVALPAGAPEPIIVGSAL